MNWYKRTLEREESNSNKKYNILEILENIGTTFTGIYLYYGKLPKETLVGRSIADRIKSRKEGLSIINKNKENINNELVKECFDYSNRDTMIKRLEIWKNQSTKI